MAADGGWGCSEVEMKTQGRILFMVAGSLAEFGALVALLADPMGALHGFLTALAAVTLAVVIYLRFVRPWQVRWGATGEEVARPMPGDDIAGPGARCTTRAVTIQAPAGQVWPLLAQPGYGRAGWYSYDWRDNPGQRSAGQIRPRGQQFSPRDDARMMPGAGFDLVQVEDGHYFVVRAPDQTTSWCLDLEPLDRAQLPADQPVACQVVQRPGQCSLDRAVRPQLLHHRTPDAAQDQGTSRVRGAIRTRPAPLSRKAVNPPAKLVGEVPTGGRCRMSLSSRSRAPPGAARTGPQCPGKPFGVAVDPLVR